MGKHHELPESCLDFLIQLLMKQENKKAVKIVKTIREGDEVRPPYERTLKTASGE